MPKPFLPRRRLPWDVLLLVFEQADAATLAVLGRVSLDFLSATAPLLYKEVVVKETGRLEQLFCERKEESKILLPSRISTFLSLSQIRNLTLDFASLPFVPTNLHISSSRLDSTGPLPLDNLQIHYQDGFLSTSPLEAIHSCVLPHLNPRRCTFHASEVEFEERDNHPWICLGTFRLVGWSRLIQVDLFGLIPYSGMNMRGCLVGLSPPLLRRLQIRLHLASIVPPCYNHGEEPDRHWEGFFTDFEMDSQHFGLDSIQPGSLVVVARSEEEKMVLEEAVRLSELTASFRTLFSVELDL